MDNLLPFSAGLRFQDVVDITLNSYLLFRAYVLFRGTNAFRVLIGIALLWSFQRIAGYLGLVVTSWAIQGITALAALIIIVVFRNEIRSVLQAKNLKTILWGFPRPPAETPVTVIVEAVYDMARRRCGALLVFPGKEALEETVHSGIPWGGRVSREMIKTIFWPGTPAHDGAAVIQGRQVLQVGVILPLSQRQDLPSHYGTRHRAAVGVTEQTDALAVVVSEERGDVAVAKAGRIRSLPQPEKLARVLSAHLGLSAGSLPSLRKQRMELGVAALVSLLFMSGIWFSFTRGLYTLTSLEIPVEYTNRDPGLEIVSTSANAVRLQLSGAGPLIKSVRPEQAKVRLDLSKAPVGRHSFDITGDDVSLPPGVFLQGIEPAMIEVNLDVLGKKELPVQVDWVGRLPGHIILREARIDPERITVVGGKRVLETVSTVYTEKVAVDGLQKSGSLTLKLVLSPASLKLLPGSRDRVTLTFEVQEREAEEVSG